MPPRALAALLFLVSAFAQQNQNPYRIFTPTTVVGTLDLKTIPPIKPFPGLTIFQPPADARKINGRWWTPDNRELRQTIGGFWEPQPKIPNLRFFHHRPLRASAAGELHLFLTPNQVAAFLGEPNQKLILVPGESEKWRYFSADGTATELSFFQNLLGDVQLQGGPGQKGHNILNPRRPPAIESELNGRNPMVAVSHQLAPRSGASARSRQAAARPGARARNLRGVRFVDTYIEAEPDASLRLVPAGHLAAVTTGMTRAEVVSLLGEPNSSNVMNGCVEGVCETMTYHVDPDRPASIKLAGGKVTKVVLP